MLQVCNTIFATTKELHNHKENFCHTRSEDFIGLPNPDSDNESSVSPDTDKSTKPLKIVTSSIDASIKNQHEFMDWWYVQLVERAECTELSTNFCVDTGARLFLMDRTLCKKLSPTT